MTITRTTQEADDQLRKELERADLGKFQKAVKKVLAPVKPRPKADPAKNVRE